MGIEDDFIDQERWDRMLAWYKQTHQATCPDLVAEDYGEEKHIAALKKELMKKAAMIDWLAAALAKYGAREQRWRRPGGQQVSEFDMINQPQYWIDKAQEEVMPNARR